MTDWRDDEEAFRHHEQEELQRDLEGIVSKCSRILTDDEAALLKWATGVNREREAVRNR